MFTHHIVKLNTYGDGYGIISSHKTFNAAKKKADQDDEFKIVNFDSEIVDKNDTPTGETVDIQFIKEHRVRWTPEYEQPRCWNKL
ncbi:MAG: hypothetical protein HUN04_12505 [Desulfobacter sp.]|nr:MAG: hypothetical protein HUN04_12505 [Desulfobacter sp.]